MVPRRLRLLILTGLLLCTPPHVGKSVEARDLRTLPNALPQLEGSITTTQASTTSTSQEQTPAAPASRSYAAPAKADPATDALAGIATADANPSDTSPHGHELGDDVSAKKMLQDPLDNDISSNPTFLNDSPPLKSNLTSARLHGEPALNPAAHDFRNNPSESQLHCVGEDVIDRTCHFRYVVYDRDLNLFKFLAPQATLDEMPEVQRYPRGEQLNVTRFLMLGVLPFPHVRKFHIAFVDEPFPAGNETCEDPEPTYLHTTFHSASFGHVLRDNFNVIAGNLLRLGLNHIDHKLLVMNTEVSPVLQKYAGFIATSVHSFDEAIALCGRRFMLFRNLVAGHGNRTLVAMSERRRREKSCSPPPFLAQRDIAMRLAGLPVVSVSQIPFTRVLILDREPIDKRLINNIPDLLPPLRQRFRDTQIVSHTLLHLSARDQLKYLSQTSVLVTTIGSASFRLLYLPTDAHVVLIGSPENVRPIWADRAVHEAMQCWNFIGFVTINVYHVTEKDESVRRFVKKHQGPFPDVHSLIRDSDIHVNVTKLGDLLDVAMADIRFHKAGNS